MRFICSGYLVNNLIKCYTEQFKEACLILIERNNEYTEVGTGVEEE